MPKELFDLVASVLRYLIIAVVLFIAVRAAWVTVIDFRRAIPEDIILGALEVTSVRGQKRAPKGSAAARDKTRLRKGKVFPLGRDVLIGSARKCDVRINHPSIARVHAQIWEKDGIFFLSPVQGQVRIGKEELARRSELFNGDVLTMGALEFTLHVASDEQEGDEDE